MAVAYLGLRDAMKDADKRNTCLSIGRVDRFLCGGILVVLTAHAKFSSLLHFLILPAPLQDT